MDNVKRISYPIVLVVWHDAVSSDEWTDIAELEEKCAVIHSIGYLLKETEGEITLAQNLDLSNDSCSMTITIPIMWIEELKEISI